MARRRGYSSHCVWSLMLRCYFLGSSYIREVALASAYRTACVLLEPFEKAGEVEVVGDGLRAFEGDETVARAGRVHIVETNSALTGGVFEGARERGDAELVEELGGGDGVEDPLDCLCAQVDALEEEQALDKAKGVVEHNWD